MRERREAASSYHRWTAADDAAIRDHYPSDGPRAADRLPGRSREAVMSRAAALGVARVGAKRRPDRASTWTAAEDALIRQYFPDDGARLTADRLPGRQYGAVRARAYYLGLRRRRDEVHA